MSIDQRPSMDVAILAGRVPWERGLYVIGPFADRVSFASQQRRAISLVCAIDDDLKRSGDPRGVIGKKVCIVGAGLAGLTCSVALSAMKADNWILEAQREPLLTNVNATHRQVHPTINFWPREEVNATTNLPFFNWYHDGCASVLSRIFSKWNKLAGKRSEIKGIWRNCTVKQVKWRKGKWTVSSIGDGPDVKEFDLIVFATGFGRETVVSNSDSPSYWNAAQDRIDRLRDPKAPKFENYVISGTGDGGLIEVLRLLYERFQAGRAGEGTESVLENEWLQSRLCEVEAKVRLQVSDQILHYAFPLASAVRDEITKDLWREYDAVYSELSEGFRTGMAAKRTPVRKVILLGKWATPLEFSSAPYHRLLIMHAIREGWVEYRQVVDLTVKPTFRKASSDPMVAELDVRSRNLAFRTLSILTGTPKEATFKPNGGMAQTLTKCFFLNRHGTENPLKEIFKKAPHLVDYVRKRQSLYADQDWISKDQADRIARELWEVVPSDRHQWMSLHFGDAAAYFKKFGLDVEDLNEGEMSKFVLVSGKKKDPRYTHDPALGELPKSFYGVPVDRDKIVSVPVQLNWSGHP